MLFNSYIFLFLPVTLLGFHLLGGRSLPRLTMLWLVTASLFFYGWWNPSYLVLIIGSMLFNYAAGSLLRRHRRRGLLALGVGGNLALLAYYKYANFCVDNLNALAGSDLHLESIILPLAISFFTFQQIAYLVDTFRGETEQHTFLHYALFVTFFPQLIAGPIVHHREMLPQFLRGFLGRLKAVDNPHLLVLRPHAQRATVRVVPAAMAAVHREQMLQLEVRDRAATPPPPQRAGRAPRRWSGCARRCAPATSRTSARSTPRRTIPRGPLRSQSRRA